MPLIRGPILPSGAVIDAVIGVSPVRRKALARVGFPIPPDIPIRALIDTGANVSGVAPALLRRLGMAPHGSVEIYTPSTPTGIPHPCDLFAVSLSLVAGGQLYPFADSLPVIAADGWHPTENTNALIGRDILARCTFQYFGTDARFEFAF